MSSSANGPRSSNASRLVRPPTQAFAQCPRHSRRRLQAHGLVPRGSTFAIKMLGRADTQSVVLPTVSAVFGRRTVDYVLDGGGTLAPQHEEHSPSARAAASADPQPVSSAAPASSNVSATQPKAAPVAAPTPSAPEPAAPKQAAPVPAPKPAAAPAPKSSDLGKAPGCAPTTPLALLPRASSRPSPHPERPSARPLPRLSRLRSLHRGNPSRCPTMTPWSAALQAMRAGTICSVRRAGCDARAQARCNCPQRGGRSCSSLGVQPRRGQSLRPSGRSPCIPQTEDEAKASSAASSVSPPSSNRWSSCTGGYTAQEETSLNGASL